MFFTLFQKSVCIHHIKSRFHYVHYTSNRGDDSRIIITATAASFLPHVTSAEKQQQESSNHQRDVDFSRLVVGPQYHQLKYTNTIMLATCLHMRPITLAIRTIWWEQPQCFKVVSTQLLTHRFIDRGKRFFFTQTLWLENNEVLLICIISSVKTAAHQH